MKRKKEHRKSLGARLVSLMLAAVMLVTMVPSTAFASPAREEEDVAVAAADGSAVEVRKELTAAPLAFTADFQWQVALQAKENGGHAAFPEGEAVYDGTASAVRIGDA